MALKFNGHISPAERPRTSGNTAALLLAGSVTAFALQTGAAISGGICTLDGNEDVACLAQHQTTYYHSQAVSDVVGGRVGPMRRLSCPDEPYLS